MSSLAALLLTYLNEEDAFWGMVTLIGDQKYAMHGKFDEILCYNSKIPKIYNTALKKNYF